MGLNPEVPAFNPPCTARDVRAFAPALQQFMLCFHFDSVKKCNDAHLRVIESSCVTISKRLLCRGLPRT